MPSLQKFKDYGILDEEWFDKLVDEIYEKSGQFLGGTIVFRQSHQLNLPFNPGTKKTYSDASLTFISQIVYAMQEKKIFGVHWAGAIVRIFSLDPETEEFNIITITGYHGCNSLVYLNEFIYVSVLDNSNGYGCILKVESDLSSYSKIYDTGLIMGTAEMDATADGTNAFLAFQSPTYNSRVVKVEPDDSCITLVLNTGHSIEAFCWDGNYLWCFTTGYHIYRVDTSGAMSYTEIETDFSCWPRASVVDLGNYFLIPAFDEGLWLLDKRDYSHKLVDFPLLDKPARSYFFLGRIWILNDRSPTPGQLLCIDPFTWHSTVFEFETGEAHPFGMASDGSRLYITVGTDTPDSIIRLSPFMPDIVMTGLGLLDQAVTLRTHYIPTLPSDTIRHYADTEKYTNSETWTLLKEIEFDETLSVARITVDAYLGGAGFLVAQLELRRNGVLISGTSISFYNATYETKTWNLTGLAQAGDKIQLYGKVQIDIDELWVKNYRIKYDVDPCRSVTVNID